MADREYRSHEGGRREFLWHLSAAAAAGLITLPAARALAGEPAPATATLPSIRLGPHQVSRMFAGWNPVGGHSHTIVNMSNSMREWFTIDRTAEFLENCLHQGITGWQYDYTDIALGALRKLWEKGLSLTTICLHAERSSDVPIKQVITDTKPVAIVHHGSVTDASFRGGKPQKVRDFVKKVKDAGLMAGVSTHSPANLKQMADEGWENDFFMTCFYYVTRPAEEMKKTLGKVPVGEPFFESDPLEMTAMIRQVPKQCLAFKILAAGRLCKTPKTTAVAFKFAFENIKPTDGVIVGMFPRYSDEVAEDTGYARAFGVARS
jgi:hypothetical protein